MYELAQYLWQWQQSCSHLSICCCSMTCTLMIVCFFPFSPSALTSSSPSLGQPGETSRWGRDETSGPGSEGERCFCQGAATNRKWTPPGFPSFGGVTSGGLIQPIDKWNRAHPTFRRTAPVEKVWLIQDKVCNCLWVPNCIKKDRKLFLPTTQVRCTCKH